MNIEHVGDVEILVERDYPLDAESSDPATHVLVKPAVYPLYREGGAYFWMMTGCVNDGGVRRLGDGLIAMTPGDVRTDVEVTFPSRRFGADEFQGLRDEPVCSEGHPAQRLRIIVNAEVNA